MHSSRRIGDGRPRRLQAARFPGRIGRRPRPDSPSQNWSGVRGNAPVKTLGCAADRPMRSFGSGHAEETCRSRIFHSDQSEKTCRSRIFYSDQSEKTCRSRIFHSDKSEKTCRSRIFHSDKSEKTCRSRIFPSGRGEETCRSRNFPTSRIPQQTFVLVLDRASTVTTVDSDVSDRASIADRSNTLKAVAFALESPSPRRSLLHLSRRIGDGLLRRLQAARFPGRIGRRPRPDSPSQNWSGVRGNAPVKTLGCAADRPMEDLCSGHAEETCRSRIFHSDQSEKTCRSRIFHSDKSEKTCRSRIFHSDKSEKTCRSRIFHSDQSEKTCRSRIFPSGRGEETCRSRNFPTSPIPQQTFVLVLDRASTVTTVDSDVSDRGKHRGSLKYAQGGRFALESPSPRRSLLHSSRRIGDGRPRRLRAARFPGRIGRRPRPDSPSQNWSGVRGNAPVKTPRGAADRPIEDLWLGPR